MNGFGVSPLEILATEAMLEGLVYDDEFVYSASWIKNTATELASLGTVEVQIQINGDSDFLVQEQNICSVVSDLPIFPNYLLTIVRAGSGREVMSSPQHVANICGSLISGGSAGAGMRIFAFPGKKPCPGLWVAKNTITCRLQNLTTTVPDRIDLSFVGFKVFYTGSQTRQQIFHSV